MDAPTCPRQNTQHFTFEATQYNRVAQKPEPHTSTYMHGGHSLFPPSTPRADVNHDQKNAQTADSSSGEVKCSEAMVIANVERSYHLQTTAPMKPILHLLSTTRGQSHKSQGHVKREQDKLQSTWRGATTNPPSSSSVTKGACIHNDEVTVHLQQVSHNTMPRTQSAVAWTTAVGDNIEVRSSHNPGWYSPYVVPTVR